MDYDERQQKKDPFHSHLIFADYAVCLLDILGQKEKLKEWDGITPEQLTDNPPQAFKDTAGRIIGLHKLANTCVNIFSKPSQSTGFCQDLLKLTYPATIVEKIEKRVFCGKLNCQQFSDTLVFYSPLKTDSGDIAVSSLCQMLFLSAFAIIHALASGYSVRGAVAIGKGVELSENNIYGPVLAEAHYYESAVAEYPRIVLSEQTAMFIHEHESLSQDELINKGLCNLLDSCKGGIIKDTDGVYIVDYASMQTGNIGINLKPMLDACLSYAKHEMESFNAMVLSQNEAERTKGKKLYPRYKRLVNYLESRTTGTP